MKKSKGFTLVELIIVIVIVGILSIVAVPIYRGYTKKAIATEAKALLGSIATAQRVYYAEFGNYYAVPSSTTYDQILDIDARSNKYFDAYRVDTGVTGTGLTATNSFISTVLGKVGSPAEFITITMDAVEGGEITTKATGLE